jgi:hypothetical protein
MKTFLKNLLYISLYALSCVLVIAHAEGYRLDFQGQFNKTSGVIVDTDIEDTTLSINHTVLNDNTAPYKISWLAPGPYVLKMEKPGFTPWTQEFTLVAGEVKNFEDIVLVPEPLDYLPTKKSGTDKIGSYVVREDYEVWFDDGDNEDFITRFRFPVEEILQFNAMHIVVRAGEYVYFLDVYGNNQYIFSSEAQDISVTNTSVIIENPDAELLEIPLKPQGGLFSF